MLFMTGSRLSVCTMQSMHDEAQDEVPLDTVYDLLKNDRRRKVMHILNRDGKGELRSLADEVAANEYNKEAEKVTSQERKRVYVALYQSHLPKMDDANVIEYNKDRGTIETGEEFNTAYEYIDGESDVGWSTVYFSYGIIASIAVASIGVMSASVAIAACLVMLAGVCVLSGLQYRQ